MGIDVNPLNLPSVFSCATRMQGFFQIIFDKTNRLKLVKKYMNFISTFF